MGKGDYLGEFELVVLMALSRIDGDAYGMTIYDEIRNATQREVAIPSVYVTLTRLEKKGFVSSTLGESTAARGGRAKKFYQLEPDGVAALNRSLDMLDRLSKGMRTDTVPTK
jgi:DNA-binding PadR family transcriptional regulator